ncbi:hypothetical protein RclHR1_04330001 [Rhizophagus clarus]|uniref:Uncharacterized protein n=1 Tax=Rhizophagus clarus TaxID=94130 RepID=A0A2Z6RL81_9GLOM|nr:hypothetical protein RclHR1_04330001 [Rhizophagus clarus]
MDTEVTSQNLKLRLSDKNHEPGLWKYVSRRIIQPGLARRIIRSGLGCQTNNMTWTLKFGKKSVKDWD